MLQGNRKRLAALVLLVVPAACGDRRKAIPASPPARIENARKETELATVTLSEKAESRLGVRTAPVERRRIGGVRTYGGEIVVPRGGSILVSAPVAGTVLATPAHIAAGAPVRKGQLVMRLVVLPSSGDLASAGVRLEASRKKVERAARLVESGAGSQRQLEEARAELELIESAANATRPHGSSAGALSIESPLAGVIRELLVGAGQSVAAGAPLFHVDASETIWVRVPIYVGDMGAIERNRPVRVRAFSATPGDLGSEALPVVAPPSADPLAATSDLYFGLPNPAGAFRPGQKVEVTVGLLGSGEDSLVVPWSAVVYDIDGGTWVYENPAGHVFSRRRVEIKQVVAPWAVLGRGPPPGTRVVSVGAAEIFGAEFGNGK